MSERRITTLSTSTVLLLAGSIVLGVLLWQLQSLLLALAVAVVLAAALAPLVERVERLHLPRWLAVLLVYLGLIAGLTGIGLSIGPTVVEQIQILVRKLPSYLDVFETLATNIVMHLGLTEPEAVEELRQFFDLQAIAAWTFRSSQQLLVRSYGITRGFFGGAFNLILSLLLSAYMLAGAKALIGGLVSLLPQPWDERFARQVKPMSKRMGGYIQGRVLVSAILGTATTVGLTLLGLSEFALGLGAIAGITNLIPFFGPILGAIPALIVASAQPGWTFLWVFLFFLIIQNLETYVLDPLLVANSVRIPPLYQLLAVLGGAQVLGIIGALIVPPWVAGISVLLENLYLKPKLLGEQQIAPKRLLPVEANSKGDGETH